MDFQQLLAKMNELSQPAPASTAVVEQPVAECPPEMGPTGPMGSDMGDMGKPDTPPPSMSVNLNAQGMENIEDLLKLVTKVNPDMAQPTGGLPPMDGAPEFEIEPMDKPAGGLGDLGNLDAGPLKMLPDLDAEEPGEEPGEGPVEIDPIDRDGEEDGEADNDDDEEIGGALAGGALGAVAGGPLGALTGAAAGDSLTDPDADEVGQDKEEEESFGNSVGDSEPEVKGVSSSIPNGNDLNKEKKMTKHSYRQGDNPMAMEGEELRAWIKSELTQRLAEVKGAK